MGQSRPNVFLAGRIFLPAILLALFLSSCTQKMICPAYQSAFIFDTTALKQKFSYFKNDTPRIYEVNKNKFLLIEPLSYRKQMASFRTIEMLPIYPVIPDSLRFQGDAQMNKDKDVQDSLGVQPDPLHPGLIGPKFNVEQENYMYYFRKILVLPDVKGQISNQKPEKKKFFARVKDKIKGIFKKKDKKKKRQAEADPNAPPANATDPADPPKEKSGIFDKFKRTKKQAEVDPNAVPPPGNMP